MAGEVENIAISTQVEVVVELKLELSLAIVFILLLREVLSPKKYLVEEKSQRQ